MWGTPPLFIAYTNAYIIEAIAPPIKGYP